MSKVCIIRHGHTASNAHRYAGRSDEPLDQRGALEALRVAEALEPLVLDRVYSSPLRRAMDTAELVALRRGLALEVRASLLEFDFGLYERQPKSIAQLRLRRDHWDRPVEMGECLHDVVRRVSSFAEELKQDVAAGLSVAIVSHYWPCRILNGMLRGFLGPEVVSGDRYKPSTGSVRIADAIVDRESRILVKSVEDLCVEPLTFGYVS